MRATYVEVLRSQGRVQAHTRVQVRSAYSMDSELRDVVTGHLVCFCSRLLETIFAENRVQRDMIVLHRLLEVADRTRDILP